ncbi:MAG: type II RES/Xre toxin-antitoxin system antitoxin [Verrucomicrobiales bacterium]
MSTQSAPLVESFLPAALHPGLQEEAAVYQARPIVERLRQGLPLAEFRTLQELLDIPEEELGRLLGISPATLNRRKKARRFAMPESERIVRFARLFGLAMDVFEAEEAAREWLKTSNPGTANEAPLSYADTEFGAREVENLLGRIDHGIF